MAATDYFRVITLEFNSNQHDETVHTDYTESIDWMISEVNKAIRLAGKGTFERYEAGSDTVTKIESESHRYMIIHRREH